jgi:hypothetical protein
MFGEGDRCYFGNRLNCCEVRTVDAVFAAADDDDNSRTYRKQIHFLNSEEGKLLGYRPSGGALLHGHVFSCVGYRSVPARPLGEGVLPAR